MAYSGRSDLFASSHDSTDTATVEVEDASELLAIAVEVAIAAGDVAAAMRPRTSRSSDNRERATAASRVEAFIRHRLKIVRAHDGMIGGGGTRTEGSSDITWVASPLDGIGGYFGNSPRYAVSIAATRLEPSGVRAIIAGCVFAPEMGALYSAAIDHPALRNGNELHVRDDVALGSARICVGVRSHKTKLDWESLVGAELSERAGRLRIGLIPSLDICAVAEAELDAYFQTGLMIWEYAAAAIVASRAGASVGGVATVAPTADLVRVSSTGLAAQIDPYLLPLTHKSKPRS
jgi:myo-inositol-1(or 4)-monophosphatase